MKAFVIKNKNGEYHKRGFSCWENIERDGVFNTGHFYYENKEEAESCIASYGLKDCEVVEITIAEGDLEKELKKLKQCNESLSNKFDKESDMQNKIDVLTLNMKALEQQLVEKDEEIQALKELREFAIEDKKEIRENRLQEIIKLEKELAEKDKEINKLQQMAIIDMQTKEILELQVATIRKQVCDKIREFIDNNDHSEENEVKQSSESVIYTRQLYKFLDQIEQKGAYETKTS